MAAFLIIFAVAAAIVAFIVVSLLDSHARAEKLREAERAYREGLRQLKANPTDPDLRERTLHVGRIYSQRTREDKHVTLYDEMAIMNDINAACAAAAAAADTDPPPRSITDPIEERLTRLSDLKERGIISTEEYQNRRESLLLEI